jgi:hypothetical protein
MRAALIVTVLAAAAAASAAAGGSAAHGVRAPRLEGQTNSTATNWAGYAVTGSAPFTDVKGSWTEPSVSCPTAAATAGPGNNKPSKSQQSYAAFWVGLDGDLSNTVEQTGTDSDCNGSSPSYYAWYEFYPALPVYLPDPVGPGDKMSGEVSVANGSVTVTISDASARWTFSASQADKKYPLSSAEWIAEAPSSGHVLPLADFGTVTFTGASATGNGVTGPISAFADDPITMVTDSGTTKAAPSGLSGNGTSFSVTWSHS